MTNLFECIQNGMDGGEIDRIRGKAAQQQFQAKTAEFMANGANRVHAEALAAGVVRKMARRQALIDKHRLTAHLADMGKAKVTVDGLSVDDMKGFLSASVENIDYDSRSLVRYFNGRLGKFLKENHKDWKGALTKPATMRNIVREMHGEATGDEAAAKLAEAIRSVLEEARLMHNSAGGYIGKREGYFPHRHDPKAIRKAGFKEWSRELLEEARLDWTKIQNHATGDMFQTAGSPPPSDAVKTRFLKEIYGNIV